MVKIKVFTLPNLSLQLLFMVPMYMDTQTTLTTNMRAILVDWLVEVQENFELNHGTLYLAVKLVDTYLSIRQVPKENLQLVGAASLFVACKFDVSFCYLSSYM